MSNVIDLQEEEMSKLLINESPLQVQPSLAMAIGLNEAIFLQQLHYWLGASKYKKDGVVWIYNTHDEWLLQLKYMSLATLKRTIRSLKDQRLIHVERFEKARSNQVNFYSIDYETLSIIESNLDQVIDSIDKVKMSQSSSSNWSTPVAQNEPMDRLKMSQSLQENTQENTQEKGDSKKPTSKAKITFEKICSLDLLEGVNRDLWIAYIEMRQSMKKLPTQKAIELILADFQKWGSDKSNQALENSIRSNWVGLFEPKQAVQTYANTYKSVAQIRSEEADRVNDFFAEHGLGTKSKNNIIDANQDLNKLLGVSNV